ncbi:MAG: hypothetical protein ACUVRD_08720 [Bacteroidia bacterium]
MRRRKAILFFLVLFLNLYTVWYYAKPWGNPQKIQEMHRIAAQGSFLAHLKYRLRVIYQRPTDIRSYLEPVENYIKEGRYYFVNHTSVPYCKDTVYAGRMPYVGLLYYAFGILVDTP